MKKLNQQWLKGCWKIPLYSVSSCSFWKGLLKKTRLASVNQLINKHKRRKNINNDYMHIYDALLRKHGDTAKKADCWKMNLCPLMLHGTEKTFCHKFSQKSGDGWELLGTQLCRHTHTRWNIIHNHAFTHSKIRVLTRRSKTQQSPTQIQTH